jgi:primary-amine oxidase
MVLERLQQMASHVTGQIVQPHPFDPLSKEEIAKAVEAIRREHPDVFFNAVSLYEPPKADMMRWLASPETVPRPPRIADVVCIGPGSKVYDGLVDLQRAQITKWE